MKTTLYQLFGSQNSLDVDVVFFIEKLPESVQDKLLLSKQLGQELTALYPEKTINPNLAECKNGRITKVYKGTTDELNNALFYTYHLHQQQFCNQIQFLLHRDVDLKFLRSSRMILSFLSKTHYRTKIKEALKGTIHDKLTVLEQIDFQILTDFGKGQNTSDTLKSIAFQMGQSIALHHGKEYYTKNAIANNFPDLKEYLYRTEFVNFTNLQYGLIQYVHVLKTRVKKMKYLIEYRYEEVNKI